MVKLTSVKEVDIEDHNQTPRGARGAIRNLLDSNYDINVNTGNKKSKTS